MAHKLIMLITDILIGHKKAYIILISLLLTSCRLFFLDDQGDYSYKSYILNDTEDTLKIISVKDVDIYGLDRIILPSEYIPFKGGRKVYKGDDVLKEHLFVDSEDSFDVLIYLNNKLAVKWIGPAQEMGDSIHHFYNYDSWDVELIDNEYEIIFTILESDMN